MSASFLHRFGSSLNAHFHFHVLVIDGVFSEDGHRQIQFYEACCLQPHDWELLQATVQHRVLRYFRRHGPLDEEVTEDMLRWQGTGGFSIDASVRIEGQDRQGIDSSTCAATTAARNAFLRSPARAELLAQPEPAPHLASAPRRASESPIPEAMTRFACP